MDIRLGGFIAVSSFVVATFVACGDEDTSSPSNGADGGSVDATATQSDAATTTGANDVALEPAADGGAEAAPPLPVMYAHTFGELYRFDPASNQLTMVGAFQDGDGGGASIIDLAIASDGGAVASSFFALYTVDLSTGKLTRAPSSFDGGVTYPAGLTFVPRSVLEPNDETLVGFVRSGGGPADVYVRIDRSTGAMIPIGALDASGAGLSGDLAMNGAEPDRAYATLTRSLPDGGRAGDELAEIDPKTGGMRKTIATLGEPDVWGLTYADGVAYGFSASGRVIRIDPNDGGTSVVATLSPLPEAGLGFWGAAAPP